MKPTRILIALAAIVYAAPALEQTTGPPLAELNTYFQPHVKRCKKGPPPYYGEHPYPNHTYNELTDGTPCRNVTMIYARGMGGKGNVGEVNGVGPAIFNRLATLIGGPQNLAVAGVKYKANMKTVIQKAPREGGRAMTELINRAASQCPETKIVIMGHSVGGALVHQAAENITTEVTARIVAG
ncbi:cutinase [Fusarium pseudocircinatum]|uniref:cutinase n=1 Tax=Fusarium pseudocircinatum TaxID=56676 RepID=A0A8H5NSI1_9HYPO|nr:cutinase [Fusarium pseudocircinatum]